MLTQRRGRLKSGSVACRAQAAQEADRLSQFANCRSLPLSYCLESSIRYRDTQHFCERAILATELKIEKARPFSSRLSPLDLDRIQDLLPRPNPSRRDARRRASAATSHIPDDRDVTPCVDDLASHSADGCGESAAHGDRRRRRTDIKRRPFVHDERSDQACPRQSQHDRMQHSSGVDILWFQAGSVQEPPDQISPRRETSTLRLPADGECVAATRPARR